MRMPTSLDDDADAIADMAEQAGVSVDRAALHDMLEELGPEGVEELLDAADPGGLVDELDAMDSNLLEW